MAGALLVSVGEFISFSPCRPGKAAGARALKRSILAWFQDFAPSVFCDPLAEAMLATHYDILAVGQELPLDETMARVEVFYAQYREKAFYDLNDAISRYFPTVGPMLRLGLIVTLVGVARTAFQLGLGELADSHARRMKKLGVTSDARGTG